MELRDSCVLAAEHNEIKWYFDNIYKIEVRTMCCMTQKKG